MPVHCTSGPCDLTCALYIVHLVCDLTWWDLPRWFHGNNLTLRDRLTQKVRLEIMLATRWAEFPGMDYSLLLPEQVMSWISTHSWSCSLLTFVGLQPLCQSTTWRQKTGSQRPINIPFQISTTVGYSSRYPLFTWAEMGHCLSSFPPPSCLHT